MSSIVKPIQKALAKKYKITLQNLGLLTLILLTCGVALRELYAPLAYILSSITVTIILIMGILAYQKRGETAK